MKDCTTPVHPAQKRFEVMKNSFNRAPLIAFAVRDGYLPDEATAERAFDGLFQWLAGHAVEEHPDHPYVMMIGDVDQAFHAFILNTRSYLHFCRDYVGFFVHHTPIADAMLGEDEILTGIDYTMEYLVGAFGERLSPALTEWANAHRRGELSVASVSCVKNGNDPTSIKLLGIADFRSFWDTNPQPQVGTA